MVSPVLTAAVFIIAVFLIGGAAALIEPRFFVVSIIVFGTLVSYLTVKYNARRFLRWLVGAAFGFLMGTAYIEAFFLASPRWPSTSVRVLMFVFFAWIGVVIGTNSMSSQASDKKAEPAAEEKNKKPVTLARPSKTVAALVIINLAIIAAISIITIIGLFRGEPLELYLTGGLGLTVSLVVAMARDRQFFSWFAFFIAGYLVAAVVMSLNPAFDITRQLLTESLVASGFFAIVGLIVGLAATGVTHLHRALHDFWRSLKE
jgi:hypothetical protein